MKKLAAALVVAASLVGAIQASPVLASDGPVAQAACKSATIGGQRKCIARGQFCARGSARDYRRYGLSCTKRDPNGRYHLQ